MVVHAAKKALDPFAHLPPSKKTAPLNPFDKKESRLLLPSIDQMPDEIALATIFQSYAVERKRMADIGAISMEVAIADIHRANDLLDKLARPYLK